MTQKIVPKLGHVHLPQCGIEINSTWNLNKADKLLKTLQAQQRSELKKSRKGLQRAKNEDADITVTEWIQ